MTDWYITNYEGSGYLENLEHNMHFVIKYPCPYAYLTVNLSLHTHGTIAMWQRTSEVLPQWETGRKQPHRGTNLSATWLDSWIFKSAFQMSHWGLWILATVANFMKSRVYVHPLHSLGGCSSSTRALSQSCRRPQAARLIQNQTP